MLIYVLRWRPSWLEVGITGHNFGRGPSKDHSTKVWLQLAQWFLRRRLKCEMLTDNRRRTKGDDKKGRNLWTEIHWMKPVNSVRIRSTSLRKPIKIIWLNVFNKCLCQYGINKKSNRTFKYCSKWIWYTGVKPIIHQSELRTYTKVVPFKEKSSFHFVVLWQILNGME